MPTTVLERTNRTMRNRRQAPGQMSATFCDHCGNGHPAEDSEGWVTVGESHYCSEDCALAAGHPQCPSCSTILTEEGDGLLIGTNCYCNVYCAERDGFRECASCGQWHPVTAEEHHEIFDQSAETSLHCCSDACTENLGAFQCEDCQEWFTNEANRTPSGNICRRCAYEHYNYCDCCGYHVDVDEWDDEYDRCTSCTEQYDSGEHLHRYGFRPTTKFFGDTHDNRVPYLGVELETDTSNQVERGAGLRRREYCKELAKLQTKPRFWMTQDGSLACGVEVTSHPMTLAEHMECGLWESHRECAIKHGFSSHDNGRCGLHVHVNRDFFGKSEKRQQVGGYNLAMLVSRFEKQLTQFSRRQNNTWCHYGIHNEYIDKKNLQTQTMGMFEKSKHLCEGKRVHSQCVNFQHSATFELRIFRGTLRLETLYASFAMTQGLARAAKLHGQAWCEAVSWADLTKFILSDMESETARTALSQYMTERGVG